MIAVRAKSIVNRVPSPDVPFQYSMNVYQGCEHGCSYCYARDSHAYHDLGTGIDFESKILAKVNAPDLLKERLNHPKWKAQPIAMSGNTDCYQPVEKTMELTRACLKMFLAAKHPVGIITKNSLIERDLDLLADLASHNLVRVLFSITTLNEELRRKMEPRTASSYNKLRAIRRLSGAGIPCGVMMGPIIPGLNINEIFDVARRSKEAGARRFYYTSVRLNGDVHDIFSDWLTHAYPDRREKVLNGIRELHGGRTHNHQFHTRMKGNGKLAEVIRQMVEIARKKFFSGCEWPRLDNTLHIKNGQLNLFDGI